MKQEPLQNLKQRTVRCLLAILALLTMPAGMWAEDYNLWVAGVQVTSDNAANVLGDAETPRVVFDASTNTLTLSGYDEEAIEAPNYEGAFIKNGLSNLTINLVGFNRVHCLSQSFFLAKYDAGAGECTATFTTDLSANEPGSIDIYVSSLSDDHTIYYDGLAWDQDYDADKGGNYFEITSNFRLSVGGAILCSSNGVALENGSFGESVVFSDDSNTLTLDGAAINGNIVVSGAMSALNIKVKGQNVINAGNQSAIKSYTPQSVPLSFTKEGTSDCSLQLNSDDITVISTGFTEPTYTDLALVVEDENLTPQYSDYADRGLYHYDSGDYIPITSATITSYTTYDIIVNGEAVTSINKNSILKGSVGVGHISFDGDHTLTLNKVPNYVLNGSYPFIQTSMDLTINLVGNNEFDCGQSIFITRMEGDNDTHTVTFTTDENNAGTLILTVGNVFDGFEAVYQNGLKRDPADYYDPEDENKPALWIAQESLGLKVGGIVVTQGNSSDILGTGYGSVSYNSTTNTLTLKGATIDSPSEDAIVIGEDIEALTVHLVGYNRIGSQDHYVFNLQGSTTLTFTTSETMPGSINSYGHILYANQQELATYENGLALNADNNEMKAETGTMNVVYLTGFVSYVNSDNGGSAFIYTNKTGIEATAAELKNNAVIVSTPEGSTQTEMWSSLDASILEKFTFQFDWGTCTNKNVKVQVVGYNQNEEEPYDWVADGKTYSDEISLSTADDDGIVEIPLTSDVTSEQVRLKFSSTDAFSFVVLNIDITQAATYPLTIAGTTVTAKNAEDVLGDGKVSYNATTHTLTLNNANIVPEDEAVGIYYSGSDNLTISLIGSNSINSGSCSPIRGSQTSQLIFAKGDNQPCSLRMENTDGWAIDGFSETNFGGLFKLESQETEDDETTYYMTLTSTILSGGSGTGADPLIIATANDLKNFASYIRESVIPNTSFAKLSDDIGQNGLDCSTLEFEPIGYGNTHFLGTFDGNNKTIKNLTVNDNAGDCAGFIRILGEGGILKDLTIDNLTLSGGNSSSNNIGGLVAFLNGGTISNCTVKNSTISCRKDSENTSNNTQNPTVGGIAGQSSGTITNCILLNSSVKAETCDTWSSGARAIAGGIVGQVVGGSISGCQVKGTTTILADYGEYMGTIAAGALFGNYSNGQLSENTYEYTVTATEKVYVVDPELQIQELQTTDKSGYTQRAVGKIWNEQTQQYEEIPDIFDNNGAVMYTQTVTLPEETSQASVSGEEDTYYSTATISDALAYLVAPGQTVTLNARPEEGYVVTGLTATNTTTEATISTNSETKGDNITQYTFTMPDAPVTVALTAAEPIGIRVAGVEVTEVNAADVLSDGKVSFTAAVAATETTPAVPATLTLNNATINGCIYVYGESLSKLVVHLQGQNTIDGGYVSSDENGDWAFGTSVEGAKLTITTDEANPGQLLIKNTYLNESENPEYYEGWYPAFANGLVESENHGDKKVFIAQGPVMTPGEGIYWPDQQYTISGREGAAIKYKDNNDNFGETTYTGAFTISTVGRYKVNFWQEITIDETTFKPGVSNLYFVYAKPTFSLASGSYAGTQNITLTNLPNNLPTGENSYPQVWYYLGENSNDSVRITDAQHEIAVTESTKVCVYILDEDTGKVLKSKPVEAEYTILDDIANAVVIGLADSVYTGEAIVPEFTVKASANAESNLTEGTDYEVSYKLDETTVESMINVATYTIVISGKGSYGGTKEMTFSITQATPTITFAQESYSAILGKEFTSPATVDSWEVTPWASSNEEVATVADGEITIVGVGTTLITVFYAGDGNHLSTTASYQLVVSRALEVAFVGSNSWASYYATEDLALPEGLTAYIVSDVNATSGVVTAQSVGYIPANNGVLLQREANGKADGYVAEAFTGTTSTFNNLLAGSANTTDVSSLNGGPVYVLFNDKFKRATSGTIPARRAYLPLAVASAGAPQLMTLNVVDGDITAIRTLAADDNDDNWYTLDGFKLSGKPQHKGVYIKNGKKVYFNNHK